MDNFTDSIFDILTSQTGINRDCQNWMQQVAFRKSSFRFLILDCEFQIFRDCDLRFLNSDFWFLISSFRVLIFELLSLILG